MWVCVGGRFQWILPPTFLRISYFQDHYTIIFSSSRFVSWLSGLPLNVDPNGLGICLSVLTRSTCVEHLVFAWPCVQDHLKYKGQQKNKTYISIGWCSNTNRYQAVWHGSLRGNQLVPDVVTDTKERYRAGRGSRPILVCIFLAVLGLPKSSQNPDVPCIPPNP